MERRGETQRRRGTESAVCDPVQRHASPPQSCQCTTNAQVVQPLLVTTSALELATETVSLILRIDDLTIVSTAGYRLGYADGYRADLQTR